VTDDESTPDERALEASLADLERGGATTLLSGQVITGVHDPSACAGREYGCALHRPSLHNPLRDQPLRMNGDMVLERLCPRHLVWHPDADSVVFHWRVEKRNVAIHTCCPDECCEPDD
jgi:hypothetical protein